MPQFKTTDNVTLHYLEAGNGPPLVMLHGWSQGAALFKHQIEALSDRYRVIALDMRGHGQSDKPEHGYRVSRLAVDLHELIRALDLRTINLLGHSMGCAVIWSYWELFRGDRIAKMILVDEPPVVVASPGWSKDQRWTAGGMMEPDDLFRFAERLSGPDGVDATGEMIFSMVTPAMSDEQKNELLSVNLQFPRPYAARLLINNATQDWRDTIPTITVPTLVLSGGGSQVPWQSQQWIHEQIKGSVFEIFAADEGGSHFMFLEAPAKFNARVGAFLA
ncbi:MAG: alpha/beta hydrolase [Alphaproteobacteria bacterium]|nr:alpha/beta hydrolase [Alphaproteobacteria bacterium]